jgi:phosphinothricin acetyltransferase
MRLSIRVADPARDGNAVAEIYRPAVESSIATFEEVSPAPDEMARRMRTILRWSPWLVAEDGTGGHVVGYAYAAPHRERPGYRWSVDVSAYVASASRGQGVGRQLYDALLPMLRRQGFVNLYAGIAIPNPASVALHEGIGMRRIGVYEQVGFKFGAWHDVAWYGMQIADRSGRPAEPIALPDLPDLPEPGA